MSMINHFLVLRDRMNLYNAVEIVEEMASSEGHTYLNLEEYKKLDELCIKILDGIEEEMKELIIHE